MRYLVRFEDEAALDPALVGPKFAGLARAARAGFAVPPAVAVSTAAQPAAACRRSWPRSCASVADEVGLDSGVSVRSSATLEDLAGRSFAGVYKTFLDVRGEAQVLARIEEAWRQRQRRDRRRAIWSRRAARARRPAMAVIVQRMVPARAAGVAFSVDPVSPASGEAVVEAVAGLGERLVSGQVTPWRARVGRPGGGARRGAARRGRSGPPPLSEEQWRQVAELARAVAAAFGGPQDIEWAADGEGRIWLLQARPITSLRQEAEEMLRPGPGPGASPSICGPIS